MNNNEFITIKKAVKTFGISSVTFRRWDALGKIKSYRTPTNIRMFRINDIKNVLNITCNENEREKIIYIRVSSAKQKNDLARQLTFLQQQYPTHTVISDIGSGINYKKKGLQTLLDKAMRGQLAEVVVAHKDRLVRFGFELIEFVIQQNGGKIIIAGEEKHKSTEEELAEDLLNIIHVFNCRQMGKRRYTRKNKEVEINIKS
jgi:putative resolvase